MESKEITFISCEFSDNVGTPITSVDSIFILSGSNIFRNNRAYEGGALAFYGHSHVTLFNGSDTMSNLRRLCWHALFLSAPGELCLWACGSFHTSNQCAFCYKCRWKWRRLWALNWIFKWKVTFSCFYVTALHQSIYFLHLAFPFPSRTVRCKGKWFIPLSTGLKLSSCRYTMWGTAKCHWISSELNNYACN